MEDSSEDNITTRSVLKGILATEPVRTAVKHLSQKRGHRRSSTSYFRQDENVSSPSMNLRSKMKTKVRRSLRKSAGETSVFKRNVESSSKTKPKSAKKRPFPIMEDLDVITPRTLLKKIIQNEDEVSIVVSQRSKAVADYDEDKQQENSPTAKLSSVGSINLSLPEVQDTEQVNVFRKSRKKRKLRVSEFEREVDERLPKSQDNYNPSSSADSYKMSSLIVDKLDVSAAPESTFKRGLLRRPNKVCLVSLGDFEQGVEDKYQLLKGSQECFIEPEDKSDSSSNELAQMNTELYIQSSHKDPNLTKSERQQRGASQLFVSTFNEIRATDDLLETETRKRNASYQPIFNAQSPEENTHRDVRRNRGGSDVGKANVDREEGDVADGSIEGDIADDRIERDVVGDSIEVDVVEGDIMDDSSKGDGADLIDEGDGADLIDEGDGADLIDEGDGADLIGEGDSADLIGEGDSADLIGKGDAVDLIGEDADDAADDSSEGDAADLIGQGDAADPVGQGDATDDSGEGDAADLIGEDDAADDSSEGDAADLIGQGDAADLIGQGGAADDRGEGDSADSGEDDAADFFGGGAAADDSGEGEAGVIHAKDKVGDDLMDVESNLQRNKSSLTTGYRKSAGLNDYSRRMIDARPSERTSMHTVSVSRPEESPESSESSDDENVDLAHSAVDLGIAKKKQNNQLMLTALPETPAYIKSARFASTGKPAIGKKIQRNPPTKLKKQKTMLPISQMKTIFRRHAQVRVSPDALADVEKCLDIYVNQLAADLSSYTEHANRKTVTRADLELLMKRQRLVTDTTSLNVLIEKHLPLDCRRLLIPCAMSGNKVFPKM